MVWKQINVFPSLFLVSAVATLVIGVVTKENSLNVHLENWEEVTKWKKTKLQMINQLYLKP